MTIAFSELMSVFRQVLLKNGFSAEKAILIASIFAENSRDGIYSHGLNRFPVFIRGVQEGMIDPDAEPEVVSVHGVTEIWDGRLGAGMYIARLAMQRAVEIALSNGMGLVSVKNGNHWMRGGTYGWQAAEAGCIGICSSNTIANMPPWGGIDPQLGNNPLVIAIPKPPSHIVLDMAMTQFSYGKLQEYKLKNEQLPVDGGYDREGKLTKIPADIYETKRPLPIGFWKGSGLSFMLDMLTSTLSGGRTVAKITADGKEKGLSQFFLCIHPQHLDQSIIDDIIAYTKQSRTENDQGIHYPGERTYATRMKNEKEGIPVNEQIWEKVLMLNS